MAYKVLKPIPKGDGTVIPAGSLVDAAKWRNLRSLIGGRYLVEVADAIVSRPQPVVERVVEQAQVVVVEEDKPRTVRKSRKRDESEG